MSMSAGRTETSPDAGSESRLVEAVEAAGWSDLLRACPRLRPLEIFPTELDGRRVLCLRDPAGLTDRVAFLPGASEVQIHIRDAQGARAETIAGADEYQFMVEHFADCVRGRVMPRYSAAEAAANMRAIAALYRSARKGGAPQPVAAA